MAILITNKASSGSSSNTAGGFVALTATGTTTGYLFTVTSANATVGATYTNNGNTYTVLGTIAASTNLYVNGAGTPTASGTLTKATGTGDSTITFSLATALATYTLPTSPSPLYLRFKLVGGGGAGGTVDSGTPASSTAGTMTAFGTNMIIAQGGFPGAIGNQSGGGQPGQGGSAILGTLTTAIAYTGGFGASGDDTPGASFGRNGGSGADSPFTGSGSSFVGAGSLIFATAMPNTGSGGAGGAAPSGYSTAGGGGAGAYVEGVIDNPAPSYVYAIGSGGTAPNSSGGAANTGGAGGSGVILLELYYQ